MISRRMLDLLIVTILTGVAVLLTIIGGTPAALKVICGLPLVLVLPGYAIVEAWFARSVVDPPVKLMLTAGLSIIVAVLGGLLLNLTPLGLQPSTWAIWLGLVTLIASSVAVWRRDIAPQSAASLQGWALGRRLNRHMALKIGVVVLALVVTGAAFSIAQTSAEQPSTPGFTQLWILPVVQTPTPAHSPEVRIGLQSHEHQTYTFNIKISLNGQAVSHLTVLLVPGQTWERTVTVPKTAQHATDQLLVQLYRQDHPKTVYRYVDLTVQT